MTTLIFGIGIKTGTHESMYMVAELTGRTCQSQILEPVTDRSLDQNKGNQPLVAVDGDGDPKLKQTNWLLPHHFGFQPSISVLASMHTDAEHVGKSGIDLLLAELELCHPPDIQQRGQPRIHVRVVRTYFVATMFKRKPYKKREPKSASDKCLELNDTEYDAENEGDDEENFGHGGDDEEEALEIQRELAGSFEDISAELEEEMKDDELGSDLFELDEMNAKFVARAVEKQLETPFCDDSELGLETDSQIDDDNSRAFEDVLGEEVFQAFLRNSHQADLGQPQQPQVPQPENRQFDPGLNQSCINTALSHWHTAFRKTTDSLELMVQGLKTFEPDRPEGTIGHQLSLVVHRGVAVDNLQPVDAGIGEVSFVSWLKPLTKLEGRSVSLDESQCVVYPSHFVPKQNYKGCFMVLPNAGARVRKQEREAVPGPALRLHKMFCVALNTDHGDFLLDGGDDYAACASCVACGHGADAAPLKQCASCLLWWRATCAQHGSTCVDGFASANNVPTLHDLDMEIGELPFLFLSDTQISATICMLSSDHVL